MNDNKQVSLFQFHKQQVRVIEIDGALWFLASEVCKALGYDISASGVNHYLAGLGNGIDRRTINTNTLGIDVGSRGNPNRCFITEAGVYKLVMKARAVRPEVEEFQNWVTREVLPSIRKNGGYIDGQEKVATGEMSGEELALRGYEALMKIYEDMKARAEKAEAAVDEHLKLMTVDEFRAVALRDTRDLFLKNLFRLTCI